MGWEREKAFVPECLFPFLSEHNLYFQHLSLKIISAFPFVQNFVAGRQLPKRSCYVSPAKHKHTHTHPFQDDLSQFKSAWTVGRREAQL